MIRKYTPEFKKLVIERYKSDDSASQAQLAKIYHVPESTVKGWLSDKVQGLTPFQRHIRNRDRLIREQVASATRAIERAREKKEMLAHRFGISQSTVYRAANPQTELEIVSR